jgi:hypothetical protein
MMNSQLTDLCMQFILTTQAQCLGCAGFAAFSYAIHKFTDGRY